MATTSKILYVITQSEWGGAQRYIFDLSVELAKQGHKIHVICGAGGELIEKLNQANIDCHIIKAIRREIKPWHDFLAIINLTFLYLKIKPDIIHLNSSKISIIGTMASVIAKIFRQKHKLIYTAHGFVFNEPLSKTAKIFYILAEKLTAIFKQKIICVSEYDKATAISNNIAPVKKLITIHNAVKTLDFIPKNLARQELDLINEDFVVGCIANYYPSKGLVYLIQAAKKLKEEINNLKIVIIGFGDKKNTEEINLLTESLFLKNNIVLVNNKTKNGYQYITAFDIYCLPSVKEGLPYALLEAKQAGLPIISTMVGGIPEIISNFNNGILVEPAQPDELAETILKLHRDKALAKKLGDNAKNEIANFETMLTKTKNVYNI